MHAQTPPKMSFRVHDGLSVSEGESLWSVDRGCSFRAVSDVVNPSCDLVLERVVSITASQLWQGWTDPAILVQWFTPKPWVTVEADIDPIPGGIFRTVMCGPNGERNEGTGCVLEAIENHRFVWTSAIEPGFRPVAHSTEAFLFTAILEFVPADGGTLYRATARHATPEDATQHAEMGFEEGWGAALQQLVELFESGQLKDATC